jgi:hypothetical protein
MSATEAKRILPLIHAFLTRIKKGADQSPPLCDN